MPNQALHPRITVITLAVADLERAVRFYRDGLGLPTEGIVGKEFEYGAVAFFKLQAGLMLALWPRKSLSHDVGVPLGSKTAVKTSIGHNVRSKAEVDVVMKLAKAAGAKIVKKPQDTFYGGYAARRRFQRTVLARRHAAQAMTPAIGFVLALASTAAPAASPPGCSAEGEPVQWIADYCMLQMETDDEIAVSGCIEAQLKKPFADGCASNLHFKRGICETLVRNGTRAGSVDQCVNDPSFKGRVVEAGGVGP